MRSTSRCRSQANKLRWPSELLSTCARSAPPSIATSSLCLPVSMPAHTVVSLLIFVDPFLVMRTLGSFNHPGPMKNRSRSCSAAALAAREHPIRRPAARSRWPPGPGRSSRNGRTIAVRANTGASQRHKITSHAPSAMARCDASRSMRPLETAPRSPPSFETRVPYVRICGTCAASALLRMRGAQLLHLVDHRIAQYADLRYPDSHHVAGLEPHRGISVHAGAGRGSGPDQIARLERRKSADVVDQPSEAPSQAVGAVVLPQFPVHARRQMQRLCRVELVGRHDPRTNAAGLVEILSLRDVQRAVAQPVAHAAL